MKQRPATAPGMTAGGVALDCTEALGARMRTIDEEENEWTL